jgi:hypothetical protein
MIGGTEGMRKFARSTIIICAVLSITVLLYAQEKKEIVLKDIKPTLTGYVNNAFVDTEKVGPDKKEMTVFRRDQNSPGPLVVAKREGYVWGAGFPLVKGATEMKLAGNGHIGIDGDTQFRGNLDYDGSTYTFIGTVHLAKHVFSSDDKDPLVFKLVKDKGFVHLKGKGKVTTPDGKSITIP